MNGVYIVKTAKFLPGDAVSNDEIDRYITVLSKEHKAAKRITLFNNKIKQRYYAIDPDSKKTLFTNAELTAEAIKKLEGPAFSLKQTELLACGTSTPDQLLPSHTSMVHGELKNPSCEIAGLSGICCAGVFALKYGYMSILSGLSRNAVVSGSELVSTFLTDDNFQITASDSSAEALIANPMNAFDSAFLRWMLSDGAGAFLLQDEPNPKEASLKIEWIDVISYADQYDTCMYAGAQKQEDGSIHGWREYELTEKNAKTLFAIKQDVALLSGNMTRLAVTEHLRTVKEKKGLRAEDVTYYLPHLSSNFFRKEVLQYLKDIDFEIPESRWFTNLSEVGNIGSAAIYVMLDEILTKGFPIRKSDGSIKRVPLKKGEVLLCEIPESGRFSNALMLLTVV